MERKNNIYLILDEFLFMIELLFFYIYPFHQSGSLPFDFLQVSLQSTLTEGFISLKKLLKLFKIQYHERIKMLRMCLPEIFFLKKSF